MARINDASEVFKRLTEAGYLTDDSTGGSTDLDADVTAGSKVLSVTAETDFASGDMVRIDAEGDMEVHEVDTVSAGQITLLTPLAFDHATGDVVVEQERIKVGDITDDGVTEDITVDFNEITVSTQLAVYTRLAGQMNSRMEFSVQNINPENLLFSAGIEDSEVTGAGTASDPYVSVTNPDTVADQNIENIAFYMKGLMKDGDNVEVQLWNASVDANRSRTWNTGTGAPVPMAADGATLVFRNWS